MSQDHYNTGFELEEASEFEDLLNETQELVDATLWQRFVNYLIDQSILFVLLIILSVVWVRSRVTIEEKVFNYMFSLGVMVLYYVFFEQMFGKTPGKMITRTLVVTEEGAKPTLGHIVGRTFSRVIPFEPLSFVFGYTGWHDSISQTRVIKQPRN